MYGCGLCYLGCNPERMERPIQSFQSETPEFVISFDASLTGYGVGISTVSHEGARGNEWSTLLAYTAVDVPFALGGKSDYQNNCEFVAVIIGMWLAGKLGFKNASFILKGDSISALQWAKEDRAGSTISRRASICFSLLSIQRGYSVAETVHVPGVDNIICDGLSRGKLGIELGIPIEKYVDFSKDVEGMAYLRECDPIGLIGSVRDHAVWIKKLMTILDKL